MKKLLTSLAISALCFHALGTASIEPNKWARKMVDEYIASLRHKDSGWVDKYLAPDFKKTQDGHVTTRADFLKSEQVAFKSLIEVVFASGVFNSVKMQGPNCVFQMRLDILAKIVGKDRKLVRLEQIVVSNGVAVPSGEGFKIKSEAVLSRTVFIDGQNIKGGPPMTPQMGPNYPIFGLKPKAKHP